MTWINAPTTHRPSLDGTDLPEAHVDLRNALLPPDAGSLSCDALHACFLGPYGENDTLLEKLGGYAAYAETTRYRLVPGIW